MNTEDSEFQRLEHEALLRASQPMALTWNSEQAYAIMEAHRNAATKEYFATRPHIAGKDKQRVYEAAFTRAWSESANIAQPVQPPQRPWVGLTDEELLDIADLAYANNLELMHQVQAKLKEKNQ